MDWNAVWVTGPVSPNPFPELETLVDRNACWERGDKRHKNNNNNIYVGPNRFQSWIPCGQELVLGH